MLCLSLRQSHCVEAEKNILIASSCMSPLATTLSFMIFTFSGSTNAALDTGSYMVFSANEDKHTSPYDRFNIPEVEN